MSQNDQPWWDEPLWWEEANRQRHAAEQQTAVPVPLLSVLLWIASVPVWLLALAGLADFFVDGWDSADVVMWLTAAAIGILMPMAAVELRAATRKGR